MIPESDWRRKGDMTSRHSKYPRSHTAAAAYLEASVTSRDIVDIVWTPRATHQDTSPFLAPELFIDHCVPPHPHLQLYPYHCNTQKYFSKSFTQPVFCLCLCVVLVAKRVDCMRVSLFSSLFSNKYWLTADAKYNHDPNKIKYSLSHRPA